MYAQRASLIPFLFVFVAVWSRATPAGELELELGQVCESSLSPSEAFAIPKQPSRGLFLLA